MFFQRKQYHSFTLVFWRIPLNIPSSLYFLFIIDIFYLSGEPILPHLLCCDGFVARSKATWQSHVSAEALWGHHTLFRSFVMNFIRRASHLRQP